MPTVMVAVTLFDASEITDTVVPVPAPELATNTSFLWESNASPNGSLPTVTVATTASVPSLITDTVPAP